MGELTAALGVAALLVLAGCAVSGPPADAPTVTAAPVPTDSPATPTDRLAPGLAPAGVVDPLALVRAHAGQLRATTYHVRVEERRERLDGTPVERRVLEGTIENRTVYLLRVGEDGPERVPLPRTFYADGESLYVRLGVAGEVRYFVPRDNLTNRSGAYPDDPLGSPSQREMLFVLLVGPRPDYAGTAEVDGETAYRVVARRAGNQGFLAAWESVDAIHDYEFRATVAPSGLVREYRLSYVATEDDERFRVVRTARWTAVGSASVPVPDWYDVARERTAD